MLPSNKEPGKTTAEGQKLPPPHGRRAWSLPTNRMMLPFFAGLGVLIPVCLLFITVLSGRFTSWIWQSAQGEPAQALLTGYLRWYWAVLGVCAGGMALIFLAVLVQAVLAVRYIRAGRRQRRKLKQEAIARMLAEWDQGPGLPFSQEALQRYQEEIARTEPYDSAGGMLLLGAFVCLLFGCIPAALLVSEDVLFLPGQARADLAQIEAGELEEAVVWLSPKCSAARLPGPYSQGQPKLTTRYGMVGPDTGWEWVRVYVPEAAGFALDQDRLFEETENAAWNWEHAQMYYAAYTSNFHLVVHIQPEWPNEAVIQKR